MGVNHYISIACDGWDYPEILAARTEKCEGSYDGDGFYTVGDAVKSARENGWLVRRREALCPVCRRHLKRKSPAPVTTATPHE